MYVGLNRIKQYALVGGVVPSTLWYIADQLIFVAGFGTPSYFFGPGLFALLNNMHICMHAIIIMTCIIIKTIMHYNIINNSTIDSTKRTDNSSWK